MALFVPRLGKDKIETVVKPTPNKNEKFYDLPKPNGPPPYHLDLSRIIPVDKIVKSGEISLHILSDTDSTKTLDPTHMVENAMEYDFGKHDISFLLHVGDVIYDFGEADDY
jgi:acid phosphatase type 7